jgi:hypothetical protein
MTYLPPTNRAAITGKPPAARIYARWPGPDDGVVVGVGWPLLAAVLLVAVFGLGFAWIAAECDDGSRE